MSKPPISSSRPPLPEKTNLYSAEKNDEPITAYEGICRSPTWPSRDTSLIMWLVNKRNGMNVKKLWWREQGMKKLQKSQNKGWK